MKILDDKLIPKYISSFELEEARLGQAIQHYQLELSDQLDLLKSPTFLKPILEKLKNESINLEWALNETGSDSYSLPVKERLLEILLQRKN